TRSKRDWSSDVCSSDLLTDLAAAAEGDPVKAGEQYGRHEAEGKPYSYAVTASGTVTEGEFGEIGLEIDGMPDGMDVGIAVPPFGSSTAFRDYGLDVQYGDFENRLAYHLAAIELTAQAAEHPYGLPSREQPLRNEVTVHREIAWSYSTGGDVSHVSILAVAIEVDG